MAISTGGLEKPALWPPGILVKMQIRGPQPRPTESESLVAGLGICIVRPWHRRFLLYLHFENLGSGGLQLYGVSKVRTSYNSLAGQGGYGCPQVHGQDTVSESFWRCLCHLLYHRGVLNTYKHRLYFTASGQRSYICSLIKITIGTPGSLVFGGGY